MKQKDSKPTDKQRLDWLQKNKGDSEYLGDGQWEVLDFEAQMVGYDTSLRRAIDAAIRAERRASRKGGRRGA